MGQSKIQWHAIGILRRVLFDKKNLTDAFTDTLSHCQSHDIPAIKDIAYGVLRYYGTLDYRLQFYLKTPIYSHDIYLLLLVAIYQLNCSKIADYAIVNEAVNLARRKQKGKYKNLVNAVLRNHIRTKDSVLPIIPEHNAQAYYNLPKWWVERIQKDYPHDAEQIFSAYQMHPPLALRVNLRKTSVAKYMQVLEQDGIQAETWGDCGVHVLQPRSVRELPYFFEGYVSVQDLGAQQAIPLLDVQDGAYVLDACAAPGGKTGHLLEWADCELLALDISEKRLQRVAENLQRLGLSAHLKCADASILDMWWDGREFDYILADIPCTASGVVKRNPDIRWLRQVNDAVKMANSHTKLIDNLWNCLKHKGKMLLATCSIFPQENQQQVLKFLQRHKNAWLIDELLILPDKKKDGFYYALVQKNI